MTIPKPPIEAWVDGACTGNPGPCGFGVVLCSGAQRKEISGFLGMGTNNVAELAAALAALRAIRDRERLLRLYTDSAYVHGLVTRPWKPKANRALVAALRAEARTFQRAEFVRVRGHAGVPENERADARAGRGRCGCARRVPARARRVEGCRPVDGGSQPVVASLSRHLRPSDPARRFPGRHGHAEPADRGGWGGATGKRRLPVRTRHGQAGACPWHPDGGAPHHLRTDDRRPPTALAPLAASLYGSLRMANTLRTAVVVNPRAGAALGRRKRNALEAAIRRALPDVEFAETSGPGDGIERARAACARWKWSSRRRGRTHHEVVNGFFGEVTSGTAGSAGTCRAARAATARPRSRDPLELVARGRPGTRRATSAASLSTMRASARRFFLSIASFGLGGLSTTWSTLDQFRRLGLRRGRCAVPLRPARASVSTDVRRSRTIRSWRWPTGGGSAEG